jgi:integrase/recombinase XerC
MSADLLPVPVSTGFPVSDSMVNAQSLLAAFLAGRTETTLRAYAADLQDFAGFLGLADPVVAVQQLLASGPGQANGLALGYKADLLNRKLKAATVNRRLAALRSVVKMARTLGMVTWGLEVAGMRSQPYRDTRGPGRDGYKKLLAAAKDQKPDKAARDTAILHLLYDLALRRGEVVALELMDVDLVSCRVAVMGKGRTEKEFLTLPEPTTTVLRAWMEFRGDRPGALFINFDHAGKGERLTGKSVERLVKRLGMLVGIKARPHGLRHSAITEALTITRGDVRRVQKFSRHLDSRTVLRYDDCREDVGGQVAALVAEEGNKLT